jgi:hypothetical protein
LPKIPIITLVIACLFAALLSGCQSPPSSEIKVKVIVTQDFGNKIMLDKSVTVASGSNAMDALEKLVTVETKYGGGFIASINGVRSQYPETNKDWFFNINGISANIGMLDYKLCDGDIEHWDFHDWRFLPFVPAIVGDFPQPFLGGYHGEVLPTIVIYDNGFQGAAQNLVIKMKELGVENIFARSAAESSYPDGRHSNLILLGTRDFDPISELNENYRKLGFYIHFEDGEVTVWNSRGDNKQCYSDCGLIQATQNPWNPKGIGACENVVWVVSGTDNVQAQNAVDTLVNRYEEFRYACAVAIVAREIIKVPQ